MILSKDEAAMILMAKIILPTVDVVTDFITVENVFSMADEYSRSEWHKKRATTLYGIGYAMIFFIVLSYLMILPQYLRVEMTWKQKLKALPFLLTSTWPQYRGSRLLWWNYVDENDEKCRAEKLDFEQEISHIGKLLKILRCAGA